MRAVQRIALELASSSRALRRDGSNVYRTAPRSVGVSGHVSIVAELVRRGLLRWANEKQRAAVITDAGRRAYEKGIL